MRHDHNLQLSAGFPIDFAFQKPEVKITHGDHLTVRHWKAGANPFGRISLIVGRW